MSEKPLTYADLFRRPDKVLTEREQALADRAPIPGPDVPKDFRKHAKGPIDLFDSAPEKPKRKRADFTKPLRAHMAALGLDTTVRVDSYDARIQRSKDLMGIFDFLSFGSGRTVAVQVTSKANMSARRKKMLESKALQVARDAGWEVLLLGFHKVSNRWVGVEEWLS